MWGSADPKNEEYDGSTLGVGERDITAPATDAAKQWDGFKTGLKPATEFVVMARKPFDGATVDCVLEHGTGALNIDGTRIDSDGSHKRPYQPTNNDRNVYAEQDGFQPTNAEGRYPANVVFGERAAEQLDADVGESVSEGGSDASAFANGGMFADEHERDYDANPGYGDKGGPSRYFYTSKATQAERTLDGKIDNAHPTVKPQDLMEWLVKLVTAEEQTVLDPFCGEGTTLKAAKDLNRKFIGIEKQAQWADVARVRAGLTPHDPSHVRDTDDAQNGLEAYQ
jgi:site-specific DNA-methyltransferase (adenine-specific)